jgi:hypothetical protein
MMRFPYPLYLQSQHKHRDTAARPDAEPSSWPIVWAFVGMWAVILVVALLVTL